MIELDRKTQAIILGLVEEIKWEAEHPRLQSPGLIARWSGTIREVLQNEAKTQEEERDKEFKDARGEAFFNDCA